MADQTPPALTAKQAAFVREYLIDLNASAAAARAGYSAKTAHAIGNENLSKPIIAEAIQAAMDARSERVEVTADYVLRNLTEVLERCMQRAPVMEGQGKDRAQATDDEGNHIWEFNATAANKSIELLGRHLKMFTDKVEHSGSIDVPAVVAARRAKVAALNG